MPGREPGTYGTGFRGITPTSDVTHTAQTIANLGTAGASRGW
jgi:hypothetical protein